MALLFAEGFDGIGTGDLSRIFNGSNLATVTGGGVFGGQRLALSNSPAALVTLPVQPRYFGGWKIPNFPAYLQRSPEPTGGVQAPFLTVGDSVWQIYTGTYNVPVLFREGAHSFGGAAIFVEVDCAPSTFRLILNGIEVFSGAYPASIPQLTLGSGRGTGGVSASAWDDVICWDDVDNGDGFNTFPIGPQRIQTLQQTGPGNNTDWAADSGANWAAVNKSSWAGGGNGVVSDTPGEIDQYAVDDLAWDSAQIKAVIPRVLALDTGPGGGTVAHRVETAGGVTTSVPAELPQASPAIVSSVMPLAPGGQAWTKALIDGMQVGFVSGEV